MSIFFAVTPVVCGLQGAHSGNQQAHDTGHQGPDRDCHRSDGQWLGDGKAAGRCAGIPHPAEVRAALVVAVDRASHCLSTELRLVSPRMTRIKQQSPAFDGDCRYLCHAPMDAPALGNAAPELAKSPALAGAALPHRPLKVRIIGAPFTTHFA